MDQFKRAFNGDWDVNLPWWINMLKIALRYGLATILALFLVWDLVFERRNSDRDLLRQTIENGRIANNILLEMQNAQQRMNSFAQKTEAIEVTRQEVLIYYLQTLCINNATTAEDRTRCVKGPS